MIIDCTMFTYEHEAFAVRVAQLADVVDLHVVVQGDKTFSGEPREIVEFDNPKIKTVVWNLPYSDSRWVLENACRELSYTSALELGYEDAWYLVSDCDEIPHPDALRAAVASGQPTRPPADIRVWYMDWRAPDEWQMLHQPTFGKIEHYGIRGAHLARMACDWPIVGPRGWHLSNHGDAAMVYYKMGAYAHAEWDNEGFRTMEKLETYRSDLVDMLGRYPLQYTADLPTVADRFPHLLRGPR